MSRTIILVISIIINSYLVFYGQGKYKITYQIISKQDLTLTKGKKNALYNSSIEMMKSLKYELYFDEKESIFFMKPILIAPEDQMAFQMGSILAGGQKDEIWHVDYLNRKCHKITEFHNKKYLIELKYPFFEWIIDRSKEKIISGYKCHKATAKITSYSVLKKANINESYEVWFTDKIPSSYGPMNYYGLPGLVLDVVLNPKDNLVAEKIEIIRPKEFQKKVIFHKDGIKVTGDQFNKIMDSTLLDLKQ